MTDIHNPYYLHFKNSLGHGGSVVLDGIGPIYRSRRGIRGYGQISHRGRGIAGTIFSFLKRLASPLLTTLGPAAVDVASNVVKDVIKGDNAREAAIRHGTTEAKKLLERAPGSFSNLLTKSNQENSTSISSPTADEEVTHPPAQQRPPASKKSSRKRPYRAQATSIRSLKRGRGNEFPALEYM